MLDDARCRLPSDVPNLARLGSPLVITVALGRVVVVPGFGLPRTNRLRVKRPVRDVDTAHAVDKRSILQLARREPLARVPVTNLLTNLALTDLERQQTLRPNRSFDLVVRNQ